MEGKLSIKTFAENIELDELWMKKLSFTSIMTCSNLMQTMFSKTLQGITSKQWLLLTIASSMPEPPTLSDIASAMGCSRQNVKQLTEILKKNGYLIYTKKPGDRNTVRITVTKKWMEFSTNMTDVASKALDEIFEGFSKEDLDQYLRSFIKLTENIEKLNSQFEANLSDNCKGSKE